MNNEISLQKRISWGSIIAGIFTVIAIHSALMILGAAMITPQSGDNASHISTMFLIWVVVATLISLACGAFIAGRLAGNDGLIHGFMVWATSFVISTILSFMIIGSLIQTAGNVIGSAVSTTGNVIGGIASTAGNGMAKTADLGKNIFGQLDINTNINPDNVDQKVKSVLEKSNIKTLQPNYLRQQLADTKNDLTQAVREITYNPSKADNVISNLADKLKQRVKTISQPINREQIEQTISNNSELDTKEVHQAVNNYIDLYNRTVDEAKDRINQLQDRVQQAKESYANFKKEAKERADEAAKTMSRIALWGFVDLLIGAIVSALFGLWGVRTRADTWSQTHTLPRNDTFSK
ncbi:TIGR04086 family membrane protein [Commensalibacter oyaizuii]|uniref:CAP-Gly protein n=1 Tax=Commensalibacter oyaizuii TaxID=3043873 RepID=A0ABT6Q150_9PROT|nr:hypothetical protein [Commensalibacter sp. TBRC 16381]MDI2090846.1 hypothetical protein [Commensalibacter sp. TBRC 16381]